MYFFLDLKSDFRSSFKAVEKSILEKKLVANSWIKALQIYRILIELATDSIVDPIKNQSLKWGKK